MSGGPPLAIYRVAASGFPDSAWHELRARLGARAARRSTDEHPVWQRIRGPGFAIWLSNVRLADSSATPPLWEVRMETLATLTPDGERCWVEAHDAICELFSEPELALSVA